ncbi:MAG TPA: hypothetical protein VJQ47_05835 [Steroidobacteraceae bacterium]|nr:hypothetical protein [Steroidobacteraceae bacterium]
MATVRQQVNLYQPLSKSERKPFSAVTASITLSVVLACMAVIWGYGGWETLRLEHSVARLQRQQQLQQQALEARNTELAARPNPQQIGAKTQALEAALAVRRRALELLRAGAAGRTEGFAARLTALAHSSLDGLWVDHVLLSGTTAAMSLGGGTADPDLVPQYLQRLAGEPALSGADFDEFSIERPARTTSGPDGESGSAPSSAATIRFHAGNTALTSIGSSDLPHQGDSGPS